MFLCASCAPQRTVDLRQGKKLSQLILEERYQDFANKTTLRIADSNHKGEDYEDSSYFTGDLTFHGWIATCQVPSLFSRKLSGSSDIFAAGSLRWACQARTSTQLWLAFPTVVDAWYLWPSILLWIHWSMEGIWIKVAMILTGISCKSSLTMVMLVNLQDIGMPKQRTRSCALVVEFEIFGELVIFKALDLESCGNRLWKHLIYIYDIISIVRTWVYQNMLKFEANSELKSF